MTNKGIVYCLSNPSFNQQIYKIGKTKHIEDPHKRIDLLHTTGVPTPFKIEFYIQVNNMNTIEKKFHNKLKQFRISNQREFFKVSDILLIKQLFTSIQGVFIESHCVTLSTTHTLPKDMYMVEKIMNHIDTQCNILGVRGDRNPIDFLTVQKFAGSTVGCFNLARPKKWKGPYLKQNPSINGVLYEIVKTKEVSTNSFILLLIDLLYMNVS
jgi:hypothetical protein